MAGARQPTKLVIAKGRTHFTKEQIVDRFIKEVSADKYKNIEAPDYLTATEKNKFYDIAYKLLDLGIMTELDEDCLAQYVVCDTQYRYYKRKIDRCMKVKSINSWSIVKLVDDEDLQELLMKILRKQRGDELAVLISSQDKILKQMQSCAKELGLTISSRCKLEIPEVTSDDEL